MNIRELRWLAVAVPVLMFVEAANRPLLLIWMLLDLEGYTTTIIPSAAYFGAAITGLTLLTVVMFGRWIYVAGCNLRAAEIADLKFSPASRIWWFLVPFANLVMPYRGIRELWNASHGQPQLSRRSGLIIAWWVTAFGNLVLAYLAGRVAWQDGGVLLFAESFAGLALAALAIALIRIVSAAQHQLGTAPQLAEVFA